MRYRPGDRPRRPRRDPARDDYLILGHESLGRVVADTSGTFEPGDLVVAVDRVTTGPKPALVADLGATYHRTMPNLDTDVVLECTGVAQVVADALGTLGPNGIACLTGMSHLGQPLEIDGSAANRAAVLGNRTVFGSINANLRHYRLAADALAAADPAWLERMITRRVPLDSAADALRVEDGDVKVVIEIGG